MKKFLLLMTIVSMIGIKYVYDFFPVKYYNEVLEVSKFHKIDPIIVLAMIKVESNFRSDAVSRKGAVGLMQLMPTTSDWILEKRGYRPKDFNLYKAKDNIFVGTLYYKYLSEKFNGDMEKIMAAYNGGSSRIKNNAWKKIGETVGYVKKINWAIKAYEYKLPIYLKIREFLWND